ncbi:DNA primase [Halarchaeum sp. CBA1220]|uniref:DNA primase DnaG n=1 Tax=Halarchaeum sp. CBA1220 TaxID=1853682 RepID=UPI000F3A9A8E|nr:DNA primase DnaG [Halarchaeum sp. CBA1220]QLC32889.1 DNA primase [Halarchaeum sp. CBA1220]
MEDTAKYLIHADLVADGIVERSDVVGALFGQTEGLLGDDLDIHALQDASKLGRLDVTVETEGGQSFGHVTLASSLDKVETAVLGAALEAIERVGPCRADVEVARIEDLRAAKRREVTERAKELLATSFDEGAIDSDDILADVRESVRVGDVTEYEGLPAGPNVASSDAVVVVEGRADVLTLLKYGVKNAIAVEGTNVPDAVADLTRERTTTAFFDGDRGGDLIRRELEQVGDVDYVAFAPGEKSVEDLSRAEVDAALREKSRADASPEAAVEDAHPDDADAIAATDGSAVPSPPSAPESPGAPDTLTPSDGDVEHPVDDTERETTADTEAGDGETDDGAEEGGPTSTPAAADAVAGTERCHLYGAGFTLLSDVPAADAFEALRDADEPPEVVVRDGPVTQRLLDVAAQRGTGALVGTERADVVKEPASVAVHRFDDL